MDDPHHLLSAVWALLLAFGVLAYLVLDGFDLGVGILFVGVQSGDDRDVMINSIVPVWDGNETWLVFGAASLYAMFPHAYSVLLPALYPLIVIMLLGLILRGVSFEFRYRARGRGRFWWDVALCTGSIAAAATQGMILGGLMQGVRIRDGVYAGGWWDWLTPFTVLCGISTVVGYMLLGACWLIWRTEGKLQARVRRYAAPLAIAVLVLTVIVSLVTPLLYPQYTRRWFHWPGIALTSPVPILLVCLAASFWIGLSRRIEWAPLICAELWFALCLAGLGISLYPLIVPPGMTIFDAAAPLSTQVFVLGGAAVMLPIIIGYNFNAYWLFRGKVRRGQGYH